MIIYIVNLTSRALFDLPWIICSFHCWVPKNLRNKCISFDCGINFVSQFCLYLALCKSGSVSFFVWFHWLAYFVSLHMWFSYLVGLFGRSALIFWVIFLLGIRLLLLLLDWILVGFITLSCFLVYGDLLWNSWCSVCTCYCFSILVLNILW